MAEQSITYIDPPGMPEDERMTPAELKVIRGFLGLSGAALAAYLKVSARTVRHWEEGKYTIPDGVGLAIEDLEVRTSQFIEGLVEKLLNHHEPVVGTYRSDADYHADHPEMAPLPAGWHRQVCARIAQEVPGLSIVFIGPTDKIASRAVTVVNPLDLKIYDGA